MPRFAGFTRVLHFFIFNFALLPGNPHDCNPITIRTHCNPGYLRDPPPGTIREKSPRRFGARFPIKEFRAVSHHYRTVGRPGKKISTGERSDKPSGRLRCRVVLGNPPLVCRNLLYKTNAVPVRYLLDRTADLTR